MQSSSAQSSPPDLKSPSKVQNFPHTVLTLRGRGSEEVPQPGHSLRNGLAPVLPAPVLFALVARFQRETVYKDN